MSFFRHFCRNIPFRSLKTFLYSIQSRIEIGCHSYQMNIITLCLQFVNQFFKLFGVSKNSVFYKRGFLPYIFLIYFLTNILDFLMHIGRCFLRVYALHSFIVRYHVAHIVHINNRKFIYRRVFLLHLLKVIPFARTTTAKH